LSRGLSRTPTDSQPHSAGLNWNTG